MPRIRTFCWKRKDSPRVLGYLTYNEDTKEFTVEASEEGDTFSLTPQLYALIYKKHQRLAGRKL